MNIADIKSIKLKVKNSHEELWIFAALNVSYHYYTRTAHHTELKYQGDLVTSFIPLTYISKVAEPGYVVSAIQYSPLDESDPAKGIRKFLQLALLT